MNEAGNNTATVSRPAHRSRGRPEESSLLKEAGYLVVKIVAIALVVGLVFTFLFGFYRSADASMAPSIQEGDIALYYRLDKTYVAGDTLLLEFEGQMQIRRVIATAGDAVNITEEGLFINGALQQEASIYEQTQRWIDGVAFPLTVGENQVFVLGDARESASDSRVYGALEKKETLGKVTTILRKRNI